MLVQSAHSITQCEIDIRIRYSECDAMGYLYHGRYFDFFEQGRTELLRENGVRYRDMERAGQFFVVARAECTFLKPAHYDDIVRLRTAVVRMTRARIDHAYELRRGALLLCRARTTLACVDRDGSLARIPEAFFREDPTD